MTSFMLTTSDNPFDPVTNFDSWLNFDLDKGYNSCAFLSRIAHTSDQLSDYENNKEIERAIDEIIKYDFTGLYRKITFEEDANPS